MIEINGSEGEGGGQIVRSSLALAAVTGQDLKLTHIRGGRKKPGLLRQHLAGVRAITQIAGAETTGDELGSSELVFRPGKLSGGDYRFEVGSAGSAVLVAQTILPALMFADEPSTVTIGGGTHASWAPPFDFFQRCYLPQLARMNAKVDTTIESHGFYPAGGGRMTMTVSPSKSLCGLSIEDRSGTMRPKVTALVSRVSASVGKRECDVIARKSGWGSKACEVVEVEEAGGPGNVVMIELGFDNITELMIGFGKVGVKAEHVARSVLREARSYLAKDAPVGQHLADQLMLPMGIAASQGPTSEFRTGVLSLHSRTHIELLKRFWEISIEVCEMDDETVLVRFG